MTIRSLPTLLPTLCVALAIGMAACSPAPEPATDADEAPATPPPTRWTVTLTRSSPSALAARSA